MTPVMLHPVPMAKVFEMVDIILPHHELEFARVDTV